MAGRNIFDHAVSRVGQRSAVMSVARGRRDQLARRSSPDRSGQVGKAHDRARLLPVHKGTPQGGPASPFLANILLDDLDKELKRRGLPFVCYADDFVMFTRSRRAVERVFCSVNRYLTQHLRLVVNETKMRVVEADGVEYLGFVFRGRRATINVSEKNLSKFQRRIRQLTGRSRASRWNGG